MTKNVLVPQSMGELIPSKISRIVFVDQPDFAEKDKNKKYATCAEKKGIYHQHLSYVLQQNECVFRSIITNEYIKHTHTHIIKKSL